MPVFPPEYLAMLQERMNSGGFPPPAGGGAGPAPAPAPGAPVPGPPAPPSAPASAPPVDAPPTGDLTPQLPQRGPGPAEPLQAVGGTDLNPPATGKQSISPGGLARTATQDANSSIETIDRANQLRQHSIAQKNELDAQAAEADQPFKDEKVRIAQHSMLAREAVDNWIQKKQIEAQQTTREDIEARKKLYAENPHDWWGNHSIGQRVGAVLGMIGAGMQQQSASRYVDKLVDDAVAAQDRKLKQLDAIEGLHDKLASGDMKMGETAMAAHLAKKAAAYEVIAEEAAAVQNRYKSAGVRANLDAARADALEKSAELQMKANEMKHRTLVAAGAQQVSLYNAAQQRAMMEAQLAAKMAQKEDQNTYLMGRAGGHGIKKSENPGKVAETYAAHINALEGLDKLQKVFQGGLSGRTELQRKIIAALTTGDIRKIIGTGANLTEEEVKNVEALIPNWKQYFAGNVVDEDIPKQINMIRYGLAQKADTFARVTDEGSQARPDSTVGRALAEAQQEEAMMQQQRDEALAVMQDDTMSEEQKTAKLHVLYKEGNSAAKEALESKGIRIRGSQSGARGSWKGRF